MAEGRGARPITRVRAYKGVLIYDGTGEPGGRARSRRLAKGTEAAVLSIFDRPEATQTARGTHLVRCLAEGNLEASGSLGLHVVVLRVGDVIFEVLLWHHLLKTLQRLLVSLGA